MSSVVALAVFEYPLKFAAASVARTRKRYAVFCVSPVLLNVVPADVPICAKFEHPTPEQLSIRYCVTANIVRRGRPTQVDLRPANGRGRQPTGSRRSLGVQRRRASRVRISTQIRRSVRCSNAITIAGVLRQPRIAKRCPRPTCRPVRSSNSPRRRTARPNTASRRRYRSTPSNSN